MTPHVFDADGRARIKLLVNIEDGSASDREVDSIPVIERSTINTQALIDGGESLLIGGLVREFTGNTTSKVPLLGSIPGIGALFRSNTKTSNRVERLFLITPRLTRQPGKVRNFNAPTLAGNEADILASAPARMHGVSEALAARDAAWPVQTALPSGAAQVSLTRAEDRHVTAYQPQAHAASAREPSVRERLLGLQPRTAGSTARDAASLRELQVGYRRAQIASTRSTEEWAAVPGTVLTAVRHGGSNAPVESNTALEHSWTPVGVGLSSTDGWQEVN